MNRSRAPLRPVVPNYSSAMARFDDLVESWRHSIPKGSISFLFNSISKRHSIYIIHFERQNPKCFMEIVT